MTHGASSLVDVLQCPRCQRVLGRDLHVDHFQGYPQCYSHRCGQRWFALSLSVGSILPQLTAAFDGNADVARAIMREYGLPEALDRAKVWQLTLGRHYAMAWGVRRTFRALEPVRRDRTDRRSA